MFKQEDNLELRTMTVIDVLNELTSFVHAVSREAGWWDGKSVEDFTPTKLALIHSEVSEALEGFRKDLMDDHLKHRKMAEVELADVLIRVFDLAGAHGFQLGSALEEKMEYNLRRADHKPEARAAANGKKF